MDDKYLYHWEFNGYPRESALIDEDEDEVLEIKTYFTQDNWKDYKAGITKRHSNLETKKHSCKISLDAPEEYDLACWDISGGEGGYYDTLKQFTSFFDVKNPGSGDALLVAGIFLSGLLSRIVCGFDNFNPNDNLMRCPILKIKWTEGIYDPLKNIADCFVIDIEDERSDNNEIPFEFHNPSILPDGYRGSVISDSAWYKFTGSTLPKREPKFDPIYYDTAVFMNGVHYKPTDMNSFFLRNRWCSGIVLLSNPSQLVIDGAIIGSAKGLIWYDIDFNGWSVLRQLSQHYAWWIYSKIENIEFRDFVYKNSVDAESIIARYHTQKGCKQLQPSSRPAWILVMTALITFLKCIRITKLITEEEYRLLYEDWVWRLFPGSISLEVKDRPVLAERRVLVEADYEEVLQALLKTVVSHENRRHFLMVNEGIYDEHSPNDATIDIWGYVACISSNIDNKDYWCLIFRKKTLKELFLKYLPTIVQSKIEIDKLFTYAYKSKWGEKFLLMQSDNRFKARMPRDLQDQSRDNAVAIKIECIMSEGSMKNTPYRSIADVILHIALIDPEGVADDAQGENNG